MGTLSPAVVLKDPRIGRHGGGTPPAGGGGGDGNGDGFADYRGRLRRARLGLAVAIAPIIMLFVAFTSAYIIRQGLPILDDQTGKNVTDWLSVNLPTSLLLINTLLIVASSITMEFSRRQVTRQMALAPVQSIPGVSVGSERTLPWLGATVVLGFAFLAGQWMAWRELGARGFYLATTPSSSFVYLLTATHAVHLVGGLLVLLYGVAASLLRKPVESRRIVIDITAWYWHFMALLWIYVFALLEFAK